MCALWQTEGAVVAPRLWPRRRMSSSTRPLWGRCSCNSSLDNSLFSLGGGQISLFAAQQLLRKSSDGEVWGANVQKCQARCFSREVLQRHFKKAPVIDIEQCRATLEADKRRILSDIEVTSGPGASASAVGVTGAWGAKRGLRSSPLVLGRWLPFSTDWSPALSSCHCLFWLSA